MNILVVGAGKGSWQMRGLQLGAALGARVSSSPTDADWHWAERVILIKRDGPRWIARARALNIPVVWDALDFWQQPAENRLNPTEAMALLQAAIDQMQPALTIGATRAMATAAGGRYVSHHGHVDLQPTPARESCTLVGYNGDARYLGMWGQVLQAACAARGWTFVVNPPDLAAMDILVALRGGVWDGWMCRQWKSGVKLVNAWLAGRPILRQDSAASRELDPPGSVMETVSDLAAALDAWTPVAARQAVVDMARARYATFTLDAVAAHYQHVLADLGAGAEVA